MKKFILCLAIMMQGAMCYAETVTVCKWTVTAIVEAKDAEGNVTYSAHYKGRVYELSPSQYEDLMRGCDVVLNH